MRLDSSSIQTTTIHIESGFEVIAFIRFTGIQSLMDGEFYLLQKKIRTTHLRTAIRHLTMFSICREERWRTDINRFNLSILSSWHPLRCSWSHSSERFL